MLVSFDDLGPGGALQTDHAAVTVTACGIARLALSIQRNRQNCSAHEILVDKIGQ